VVPPLTRRGEALVADLPGNLQHLSDKSHALREITDRYHSPSGWPDSPRLCRAGSPAARSASCSGSSAYWPRP